MKNAKLKLQENSDLFAFFSTTVPHPRNAIPKRDHSNKILEKNLLRDLLVFQLRTVLVNCPKMEQQKNFRRKERTLVCATPKKVTFNCRATITHATLKLVKIIPVTKILSTILIQSL